MSRPCRLIEISGAPYERGLSYGLLAQPEIRAGIGHDAAQVKSLDLSDSDLSRVVERYVPKIEAFEPRYVEEMRGIAAGADVEFHHVVMINARTEVLKLAANPRLRADLLGEIEPDGCTTVVATPRAAREGRLIHAHNWDWKMESAAASVVLRIRDETGATMLVIDHDMPLLTSLCDRLVALELGQVIAEGAPAAVLEDDRVIESYLGVAG